MVWYQNGWASIRLRTSAVGASRSARRGGMRRRTYVVACGGISPMDQPSIRSQVDRLPWYHTIDLGNGVVTRSEEHTSELQSLMRISYAVFCLKKKKK